MPRTRHRPRAIAKVTRPEPAQVLMRTRLFERLDAEWEQPVIWVGAPAGAGKTLLVSSYLEARKLHGLWYQVDEGDADLATFFHYLGLAAREAAPRYRTPLPALTPEYLPGLKTFTRRYFERLYQRLKPPAVWVLDNYQEVPLRTPLHEVVRDGATLLPRGVRLIVISRAEPPPAFARLRTHAELTFLGWEALRLTLEEAQGIAALRQEDAHRCSSAGIEQLHAQTQGWAAGLVLLLDQARLDDVTIAPVDETSQQVLFDYFAGELFERAAASTQAILLKTALLPKMTARMAEELTGDPETGRVLEELHRNNFFILRRAQTEAVYEYHPLFRDFLRARARDTFAPERLSALRRQAAGILAGAGQTEEAVVLYQAAGDWASLIPLLLSEAPQLLVQGRHQMLAQWLTALPPETSEQHAWLRYWWGMARLPFDPPEAREHFERAYALFEGVDDPAGLYLSLAGVVDSYTLVWHDFTPLDHWIAVLERLCARHPEPPSQAIEVRLCSIMTALLFRQPQNPGLALLVERARTLMPSITDANQRLQLGGYLVNHYLWMGDLITGAELIDLLEPLRRLPAIAPLTRAQWCCLRAHYHLLTGDHHAQLEDATTGLAIAAESGLHAFDYQLLAYGAYAGLHAGDLPRAEAFLLEMRQAMVSPSPIALGHYQFLSALVALQRGDYAQALEHARSVLEAMRASGPLLQANCLTLLAIAAFKCGRHTEAAAHLGAARGLGQMTGSRLIEYSGLLAEASIALERQDEVLGLERLRQMLRLSRARGGLNDCCWWGPADMARLYARALEAGIEVEYVQALIRRSGLTPPDPATAPEHWPWPVKVYTFGGFAVVKDGETLRFTAKVQRKPLELLMALLALGGQEVPQESLADALWPDADGDAAYRALITTVQRLRRLLAHPEAIVFTEGCLSLDPRYAWVDARVFEQLLRRAEQARKERDGSITHALSEQALSHYRGPFLNKTEAPWAVALRERLRAKYLQHLLALGREWERAGRWEEAAGLYLRGLEADELVEAFYQHLIRCYQRQGRAAEARAVYERCRRVLAASLGTTPSPETEGLLHPRPSAGSQR